MFNENVISAAKQIFIEDKSKVSESFKVNGEEFNAFLHDNDRILLIRHDSQEQPHVVELLLDDGVGFYGDPRLN